MTIIYTALAGPLTRYVASSKLSFTTTSDSLNSNPLLASDYYGYIPAIITANYGFEGYMGIPDLNGTDSASQVANFAGNASWESVDPALAAPMRAYTSALGTTAFFNTYGVNALQADTIPVVFNMPVLGSTMNPTDFQVMLNSGELVTPLSASFLPNVEFNEMQTVVLSGYWGNRILPGESGAQYPVSVTIVQDDTPLMAVSPRGLTSLVGLTVDSKNPYIEGNGPMLVGAKLNQMSDLGEGAPIWLTASTNNSGTDLFGSEAQYRLRLYTSAGFSPDGIASIAPDEFGQYFTLTALDNFQRPISISTAGEQYQIGSFGNIEVLGIADTGPAQSSYDASYLEDHDNQYDIILKGDAAAIGRLTEVRMPSSGAYSQVYNPGGPGNDPASNPAGPFTVGSSDQTIKVQNDLKSESFVSYVEVDGPVAKNPVTGQPMGFYEGIAVIDTQTGHTINRYVDPDGKTFFTSFAVEPSGSSLAYAPEGFTTQAYSLYGALGREPDSIGLNACISSLAEGASLTALASSFILTEEFQSLYGKDVADENFIDKLYENFLGRSPDAPGRDFWIDSLSHQGATRADVLVQFSQSQEYQFSIQDELNAVTAQLTQMG